MALGLVLLGCFVLTGQGLGASGAFAAQSVRLASPQTAASNGSFAAYLAEGAP